MSAIISDRMAIYSTVVALLHRGAAMQAFHIIRVQRLSFMLSCQSSEHCLHITDWCLSPQEGDQVNLSTEFFGPGTKTNAVTLPDYRCNACTVVRQLTPGTSSSNRKLAVQHSLEHRLLMRPTTGTIGQKLVTRKRIDYMASVISHALFWSANNYRRIKLREKA
jgi:hypothetical protein